MTRTGLSRPIMQALDDKVIDSHIELYVNDFSLDLGDEGINAVEALIKRAEERGLIPVCDKTLILS